MFDKEYSFRGKHATRVNLLTSVFEEDNYAKYTIFSRNIDVYMVAPLVGFLYNRKSEVDKENNQTAKIFLEQLSKESTKLEYVYRLIMLLDKSTDINKRIDKAFRNFGTSKAIDDGLLFEQYTLGGIDYLYERLIEKSKTHEEYIQNLYEFVLEINDQYNEIITDEKLVDLCKLAKS